MATDQDKDNITQPSDNGADKQSGDAGATTSGAKSSSVPDDHLNIYRKNDDDQEEVNLQEIKKKIDKIVATGVEQQDERTESLLRTEINTSDSDGAVNSSSVQTSPASENSVNSVADSAGMENSVNTAELSQTAEKELPRWLQRFNKWHRATMSDFVFLLWLAVVVGIVAGFGAHIFNRLISIVSDIFLSHIKADKINWWLIPVPVAGIVLSGIYTRYVIHTNLTHGVTRLLHSIYKGDFILKRNLIYSPIIGGTITLGLGGSAGSEGPIACSGAAIGSNLGRWLQLKMPLVKVLVACGAGAGISGIFTSPVGGLLFVLEFLKMEIGTLSILAVMLSCLMAYGIVFVCNGFVATSAFMPPVLPEPHQFWAVMALGVLCGLYSLYYTQVINITDRYFRNKKNPWVRNILGGLVIGVSLLLFPSLYGVGYPLMSDLIHYRFEDLAKGNILNGLDLGVWGIMIVAFLILCVKCWACGSCNASGGVSSDFAPTMYAGAVAGFLFSFFCNTVFHTDLPVPAFTLLGMAAVMAGCVEAPMMTIFIVLNLGMNFRFSLAIILAAYISYIVVRVSSHLRGYNSNLMKHLRWFHHG